VELRGNDRVLNQEIEGNNLQSVLVRRLQNYRTGGSSLLHLQPASSAHAPAVARFKAGKAVLRMRCRKIVAERLGRRKKCRVYDAADRVDAEIFRTRFAASGAIEPGHRVAAAGREWLAEDVLAAIWSGIGGGHVASSAMDATVSHPMVDTMKQRRTWGTRFISTT